MIDLKCGDMLVELDKLDENSIDSIVTDPPYELNFMGKGWDNAGVSFNKNTWEKCLRVLKPGGYLLAFGGSRTFHRIACAIEDAGFEIRDTIMWLYGSGFPKSMDISKQIDKRGGESISWFGEYLKNTLKEKNMTYSDLAKHFLSKTGGITGCVHNWIEGKNMPTIEQFNKICEILDLPLKKIKEAEREVIGKGKAGLTKGTICNFAGTTEFEITAPATNLAKQWQGWGTCLKPSFEPIIIARKPFKGTLVDNVIKWGVGGLNIDECRVEFSANEPDNRVGKQDIQKGASKNPFKTGISDYDNTTYKANGRFPANTILTYDQITFDEVCGGFPNTKTGGGIKAPAKNININNATNFQHSKKYENVNYNSDSGSASRYFYCAKASKKDRDEGLPNKWIKEIELCLLDGDDKEIWKDTFTTKEGKEAVVNMVTSLKKVIEEYGIQSKKDIEWNTILCGKNVMEKYLLENKFITKTEISSTTISQILNWLALWNTKDNIQNAKYEMELNTSLVESAENTSQLQVIIKEKQGLVLGVNNVVLKMQLIIKEKEGRNEHCTVKPTELMQYLVRLVNPKGATILDPFMGSGSTGKAVMYENKERNADYSFIGIELNQEYFNIAKERIENTEVD